jgi:hypothetical protein
MARLLLSVLFLSLGAAVSQAGYPIVEMTVETATYEGRVLAADKVTCWLAQQDGQVRRISLGEVSSFRNRPGEFKAFTASQMRQLLREDLVGGAWGRSPLEIEVIGSHVIAAAAGRARKYGQLLDATARAFTGYTGRRSLPVRRIEFPLAAIIFPSWDQFRIYAEADGVKPSPTLRGYYNPLTNRIALYDGPPPSTALRSPAAAGGSSFLSVKRLEKPSHVAGPFHVEQSSADCPVSQASIPYFAVLSGADVTDTLVHEAIHQLAFNTGVHSRFGEEPRWLVEGFAMVLESESNLQDNRSANAGDRVDLERYLTFQQALPQRPKGILASLVGSEELFSTNPLGAYAEAWALTFFMTETRSSRYADYLKRLARRDRLSAYSTADRIRDFQETFGTDLPSMDAQLVRYMSELKVRTR